ncbi:MAG: twin-arginine translocation signal domain-containing protein [Alphaproteobacteria bacterium]|nr:twin-arginine translocation signal domain-containing protein [Alphaproteobacteria bacterium]
MADNKTKIEADRRSFLKFASLGGVVGGVSLLTAEAADANEASNGAARSGYAETEHVKAFYRTARF